MNHAESEGMLLIELRRIQQSCRQGLLSDKELTGFIRIVREIKLCIEHQQSYYRSLYKSSNTQSPAEYLELSYANLEAGTHVKTYAIKHSFKESAYTGPRTYVKYRNKHGYDVGRDEGRTAWFWYDLDGSEYGVCHFSIVNTNGNQFGPILEHLKEIIYWYSLEGVLDFV